MALETENKRREKETEKETEETEKETEKADGGEVLSGDVVRWAKATEQLYQSHITDQSYRRYERMQTKATCTDIPSYQMTISPL